MSTRILLPLDGSELSEQVIPAVQRFVALADACSIDVLYVIDPTLFTDVGPSTMIAGEYLDDTQRWAEGYIGDIAKKLTAKGVAATGMVRVGPPGRTILDMLAAEPYDYVFMATHGRSGFKRAVMGSVTDRVIRESQVPVVAIHPRPSAAKQDAWPGEDASNAELIHLFRREDVLSARAAEELTRRGAVAVPDLIGVLSSTSATIRAHAAKTLGVIKDEGAIPALMIALRDEMWEVRWEAAESLKRFGDAGIKAVLEEAAQAPADLHHNVAVMQVLEGAPMHLMHIVRPVKLALNSPEHSLTVPIAASKALADMSAQTVPV